MFCQKCGSEVSNEFEFCPKCGNPMKMDVCHATQMQLDEEVIDLSSQTDTTLPQEEKYKPILYAGIVFCFVWIFYAFVGSLFYNIVMERSDNMLIAALFIVSIPFMLIVIPFLLRAKHKAVGVGRKIGKGEKIVIYALIWLATSFAIVMGFADAFSTLGLLGMFSKIYFAFLAIVFLIVCNMFSNQSGVEVYYEMFKALVSGFLVATPLGYVLGHIMRMMEVGLVVGLVCFVLFFAVGGRVIFVQYRD